MIPVDLHRALTWNLSPLRPWEYWEQDAREWTEAVALKNAFEEGRTEYRESKAEREETKKSDAERVSKMAKRVTG